MKGYKKNDADTAGVLLKELATGVSEEACAYACLTYNMLGTAYPWAGGAEYPFTGEIKAMANERDWNGGCASAHHNTYGTYDGKCRLYGTGETPYMSATSNLDYDDQ